ncbi:MAG: LPS assembly lipoprotein LptE [Legionella sp.]|uniref:LPS-assembly lipoprotein LptE n=1 Tax=Legionella sp. TaxID=459 RepID=UPI0039E453EA
MKKLFTPLVLMLLLSACGFHLRGMIDIPTWLNNVAIISNNNDKQLISILTTQLEGYNIHVNSDEALANYWLVINRLTIDRQIISIGASTNPRQYTLLLYVEFMLQTRKGQIIKAPKTISVSRQLTINNDRILGSTDEENILIGEMKQDAVVQIINQLSHRNEPGWM